MVPRKIAFLLVGALALVSCERKRDGTPRILLIGVDGAEMQVIDRLISAGKLPTFARLKKEGSWGALRSVEPLLSPLVWTTIATGRKPEDHGVLDFVEVTPSGEPVPITSARRRVPAIWDLARDHGRRSGFIGWYASYPSEKVNGFTVSDRLGFHQVRSARATEGSTYPESLAKEIEKDVGVTQADVRATAARFLPNPAAPLSPDGDKRLAELAKIHATTELYRKLAPALQKRFSTDVLGVYFELVDAAGHLFMEDAPPRRPDVAEADYLAFSGVVDRVYEYQDEVIGELLKMEGPETVTIVCSDHGFKTGDERPRTSGRADVGQAPLWHRLHGVLFLHGRPVVPARVLVGASVLDVAPTALAWLGAPISKELPGHVRAEAFVAPPKVQLVDAYPPLGKREAPKTAASGDREAVEKLAALGYLSGATKRFAHDADGRTASSFLNEGAARAASGDESGALRAFGKAIELDPTNVFALVYAARIYTSRRELPRAKELLDRAEALRPDEASLHIQRATWMLQAGDDAGAEAEIARAKRIDDRLPVVYLLEAALADRRGKDDEACALLSRVEALTDADALVGQALAMKADIATRAGRPDLAEPALRRAAALLPEDAVVIVRADLAMARHDPAAAIPLYEAAARKRAGDAGVQRKLGKALAATGDVAGAEAAFQRAVAVASELDKEGAYGDLAIFFQFAGKENASIATLEEATRVLPSSAPLWATLGAAYGRASRLDQALAAYERSVALAPTPLALKTLAALVFELKHDRARAVTLWRRSLELEPGQPDVEAFLARYSPRGQ